MSKAESQPPSESRPQRRQRIFTKALPKTQQRLRALQEAVRDSTDTALRSPTPGDCYTITILSGNMDHQGLLDLKPDEDYVQRPRLTSVFICIFDFIDRILA
jgi:hypothetical protein